MSFQKQHLDIFVKRILPWDRSNQYNSGAAAIMYRGTGGTPANVTVCGCGRHLSMGPIRIRYCLRIKFEMLSRLAPRTWGWWITVATWRWTHSPARTLVRSRGRSQSATWSTQVVRNSGWWIHERWVNIKKFPWHDAFRSSSDQVRGWRLSLVINVGNW